MPTLAQCIVSKADAGLVNKDKANRLAQRYREEVQELVTEGRLSQAEAERLLAQRLPKGVEREIERKKAMRLRQAVIAGDIRRAAAEAESRGFGVDMANKARLSQDPRQRFPGIPALDSRIRAVQGQAHASMVKFMERFRSKAAGLSRDLTDLPDVVRELFGEGSGNDAARAIAGGLKEAVETLRARFNAAGGDIAERGDWGWFQKHDSTMIARVNRDEWRDFVIERLDMDRMVDENGLPMTRKQVWAALGESYDSIVSGGLSDITRPTGPSLFGSSVNKRANARFLVFRDADTWMEYQTKFGRGNLYDHIVSATNALARDAAILEVLGPYPDASIRFMERLEQDAAARGAISQTGAKAQRAAEAVGQRRSGIRALYDTVSGRAAIPENSVVGAVSQANRNIVTSAVLGGAFLSAIGDVPLQAITSRMNGLPVHRVLARHLKTFVTGSRADRELAIRLGFTAQGWASRAIAAQRILGEVTGPEVTERVTDTVLRASFLSPWTEAGRYAFQTEFLATATRFSGTSFDRLPRELRGAFQRHGIEADEWEVIRNTPKWTDEESGATFIRAEDVSRGEFGTRNFEIANRLQQMILQETEFAIITASPRMRAFTTGGSAPGTLWGEISRNAIMFKGFPVTIMLMHYGRMMQQAGVMNKAQYAAWLLLGMTTVGAIGEQMTQLSRGRDPRDMDDPGFWAKAMMRGGSLGLFGDLVLQDQNRFGSSIIDDLAGPVAGQIEDVRKLTFGSGQALLQGEDTQFGRRLSRFIEANTPGRSIWYTRLATERLVFDQLDWALDPNAHQVFADMEKRHRREHNQRFFWRPGRTEPSRAPDASRVAPPFIQ